MICQMIVNDGIYRIYSDEFNEELKKNELPDTLVYLTFGKKYNREIKKNVLPESLLYLTFGEYYDKKILKDVLPKSLKKLTFGFGYTYKIGKDILPETLTHLTFGLCYNYSLFCDKIIPYGITHLYLKSNFKDINKNIEKYTSLKYLAIEWQCESFDNKKKCYINNTLDITKLKKTRTTLEITCIETDKKICLTKFTINVICKNKVNIYLKLINSRIRKNIRYIDFKNTSKNYYEIFSIKTLNKNRIIKKEFNKLSQFCNLSRL